MSFFSKAFGSSILGVDIGTTSVKIVEVEQGKNSPRLLNYGLLESEGALLRANTALQSSAMKLFEDEASKILALLLERMKPKTKEAVASLPLFSAFTTLLSFPEMSLKELEKSIAFQAKQYIPIPMSEAAIDWLKVGEATSSKGFKEILVLLISVPHEHIKRHEKIFKDAGLTLKALEVESISLTRLLTQGDETSTFIIDIGSHSTSILIAKKGVLLFSGQSDFAGSSLTHGLASSLNVNPMRAEELKRERGILASGPSKELSTIMVPFLDAIINEVKKVEFSYKSQFPEAPKVERAILTGGGANLMGVQSYFEEQLGIPTVKAAPLNKFEYPEPILPLLPELNARFSIALGLSLREFQ